MDVSQLGLLAALAILVAVHLVVVRRAPVGEPPEPCFWLSKGAASACFVALGVISHAAAPMLAALVLAFAGDLLLVPRDARVFRVGIVGFLLAHVALGAAFVLRGERWLRVPAALVPLILAAVLVARALLPRVPRPLRGAVLAYMVVISAMVALSAGATPAWLILPALAFYANDLLVARDRFVTQAFWHRLVGLPLYYGAMAAFALS